MCRGVSASLHTRGRTKCRGYRMGRPWRLPAFPRVAQDPAQEKSAVTGPLRAARCTSSAGLQPAHTQDMVRPQAQTPTPSLNFNRLSRRIPLPDLTLCILVYLFSPIWEMPSDDIRLVGMIANDTLQLIPNKWVAHGRMYRVARFLSVSSCLHYHNIIILFVQINMQLIIIFF